MQQDSELLDELAKQLNDKHYKPYFDWIRNVITLSVAALTSLVALQQSYIPKEPKLIWVLALCWIALLLTILSGIYALRSEFTSRLESFNALNRMRREMGDAMAAQEIRRRGLVAKPPRMHYVAVRVMLWAFVSALCALSMFAVSNLPILSKLL